MPKSTRAEQGIRSLLEIALDVHMTNTGNMERQAISQVRDLDLLRRAIRDWKWVGVPGAFDTAVFELISAALNEGEY